MAMMDMQKVIPYAVVREVIGGNAGVETVMGDEDNEVSNNVTFAVIVE